MPHPLLSFDYEVELVIGLDAYDVSKSTPMYYHSGKLVVLLTNANISLVRPKAIALACSDKGPPWHVAVSWKTLDYLLPFLTCHSILFLVFSMHLLIG